MRLLVITIATSCYLHGILAFCVRYGASLRYRCNQRRGVSSSCTFCTSSFDSSYDVDPTTVTSYSEHDDVASIASTSSFSSMSSATTSRTPIVDAAEIPMDTPARRSLPTNFHLRPMTGKGLGVISLKHIAKGEFVGEYKGELMTQEIKDRRYPPSNRVYEQTKEDQQWIQSRIDRNQTLTGCYLFGITVPPDCKAKDGTSQNESRIYIDAEDEHKSSWTRFINHASLPFSNIHPKSNHDGSGGSLGSPRVWFVANRNIQKGDEICFDYGDDYWIEGDDVV